MAQNQINKQIEQIKSSLTKKYEDSDNPVLKIKSALSHLNISCGAELDLEKLKSAVTKAKNRNLQKIKKLQSQQRQRSSSSSYHHHTDPQHRKVSIITTNKECEYDYDEMMQLENAHRNKSKRKWLYLIQLICKCLTYFFIIISIFVIIGIVFARRINNNNDDNNNNDNNNNNNNNYKDLHHAQELTGIETLRLLTLNVIKSSIFNMFQSSAKDDNDMNINNDNKIGRISIIQSLDSSTIFIKESFDEEIHFVPFRKPLDSWCSSQQFSFQRDCVNVHNVRNVEFHSKNGELEFLIAGSYPRLIEIDRESVVLLNDRVFGISDDAESLQELTNNEHYQNGMKFCVNNIFYEGDKERIIVSGSCYGVLYLPSNSIFAASKLNNELQLLSTKWSSIIIDSNLNVNSLIVATNHEASIIFRSQLYVQNSLNLAITDNSYVEFKEILNAKYISMITLKGSQLFLPNLSQCKIVDLAARNHSFIEIENIQHCVDIQLSISHFSIIKIPHVKHTQITYKRQQNTQLLLPKPYGNIHNEQNLANSILFDV